ncbi:MAG TPA: histidinol dehydrogenase [Gemmatimonadaceae bacterium]|nr:histidinol dehydrogenase [Gemmatimonadaceae bacterium]
MRETVARGFAFGGAIGELDAAQRRRLVERGVPEGNATVRERVAGIVQRVRAEGDDALRALAATLDGVELASLEVPRAMWVRALDALDPALRRAMERSARNIATAHRAFLPEAQEIETEPGIVVGRRPDPLGRVGVYAPGGRAAYPSSVLMGAIPARVAGVGGIVLCSPPQRDGSPAGVVLAAAALAGVDRVFALGGAGAIAAMAYGTASVPRVDRIVGPGNAYVAEAKLQVSGSVAIDSPAGPSEVLVVADATADPALVARELVAQAEHDPDALALAIVIGDEASRAVERELVTAVESAARREIVASALEARGGVLAARDLGEAIALANEIAAEHVLLVVEDDAAALAGLRGAGTVFVGATSSVAFGDYMTGANHVLPTGGLARSYSGLSTLDFVRWTTWQRVSPDAAARLAPDVGAFADAEGLPGHAAAARVWRLGS